MSAINSIESEDVKWGKEDEFLPQDWRTEAKTMKVFLEVLGASIMLFGVYLVTSFFCGAISSLTGVAAGLWLLYKGYEVYEGALSMDRAVSDHTQRFDYQ
jgi:hypothetical protein